MPRFVSILVVTLLAVAACGDGDIVEIGIIERFDDPVVDDARAGFLEAMDEAGYRATEEVRYFRFNAEGSEVTLEEIIEELVVEEDVDVLLAIGSDSVAVAIEGAAGQSIFFALAGDPTIGGLSGGEFRHANITAGSPAGSASADLVNVAGLVLPLGSRIGLLVAPDELDSLAAAELAIEGSRRVGLDVVRLDVHAPGSARDAAREALDADVAGIVLTPSALLDDALEDILSVAEVRGVPVLGTTRDHVDRGALAATGPVAEENGRIAGELMARFLDGEDLSSTSLAFETPIGLWLNQSVADRLGIELPPLADLAGAADVVEVLD